MAEQKIRPIKSLVLYVRMKLLHRPSRPQQEHRCFHTYYKWLLWFSFSLYFFASYLIGSDLNPPLSSLRTTYVSTRESTCLYRALSESSHLAPQKPQTSLGVLKNLKVFVYDLPPKYNTDWLSNERCNSHLFASEVAIHRALVTSDVHTFDPYEADFFFVPVYVSCNFSTTNGFPAIGLACSLIASAVQFISSEYQFWNRSGRSEYQILKKLQHRCQ
ncbi:hypothetical protein QN277_024621 [Acacia crassicarpa]|uniref:Exostosin GT47 domain-containing protein n=1 Tax=Acacia crassicarpa TaxID=499986 RepID=A0AAE1JCF6_9FABA|nr:hypothetical protein QN277_024621 [Acacia crassicarpa]